MKFSEISKGLKSYGKAFDLAVRHNLWTFMLIPGVLSAVFFLGIAIAVYFIAGTVSETLVGLLPEWLAGGFLEVLFAVVIGILLLLAGLFVVKYIVLIILSPVLSWLSEITEEKISGRKPSSMSPGEMLSDLWRAIRLNLRNLFIELLLTFALFIVSFIPAIGIFAPPVAWLVQSHYAGFGLADFTLERKRYSVSETVSWVGKNRDVTTGLGIGFMLISLVPVIGWFLAPVLGTIAATVVVLGELEEPELQTDQIRN